MDATEPYGETTTASSFFANASGNKDFSRKEGLKSTVTRKFDINHKPTPSSYTAAVSSFSDPRSLQSVDISSYSDSLLSRKVTEMLDTGIYSSHSENSRFFPNNKSSSPMNATQVIGIFRIVSSTSSPFPKNFVSRGENNWWTAPNSNENLYYRANSGSTPSVSADHYYRRTSKDVQNSKERYQIPVSAENANNPMRKATIPPNGRKIMLNNTYNDKVLSREDVQGPPYKTPKSNNYVTPSRYRPNFTRGPASSNTYRFNRSHSQQNSFAYNVNRPEIIQRDNRWKFDQKPSTSSQRRFPSNRYYAYHTNAPRQNVSGSANHWSSYNIPEEVQSSLTTPELIISTTGPVPDEVPLSLAIMVGEDPGVDVSSWKSNTKQITGKQ